jgi:hypothetical protein
LRTDFTLRLSQTRAPQLFFTISSATLWLLLAHGLTFVNFVYVFVFFVVSFSPQRRNLYLTLFRQCRNVPLLAKGEGRRAATGWGQPTKWKLFPHFYLCAVIFIFYLQTESTAEHLIKQIRRDCSRLIFTLQPSIFNLPTLISPKASSSFSCNCPAVKLPASDRNTHHL